MEALRPGERQRRGPLAIVQRNRRNLFEAPETVIGTESNRLHMSHYDRKQVVSI